MDLLSHFQTTQDADEERALEIAGEKIVLREGALGASLGGGAPRIDALTSLRFFAALYVMLAHFELAPALFHVEIGASPSWYRHLIATGYFGVDFFFVLSGFILVHAYAERKTALLPFYRARLARIYPAYLFSLAVFAPHFFLRSDARSGWIAEHVPFVSALVVTMTQAWIPRAAQAWSVVAWSLSVEAAFYLLFPALLAWIAPKPRKGLFAILVASWLASLGASLLYVVLRPDGVAVHAHPGRSEGVWLLVLRCHPLMRLPEFVLGIAAGVLFRRMRAAPRSSLGRTGSLLALVGIVATISVIAINPSIPFPVLCAGSIAPCAAAVIVGVSLSPSWARALEWRPLVRLGEASYSFYLIHIAIVAPVVMLFGRVGRPSPGLYLLTIVVAVVVTVLASMSMHRFVEIPGRRWVLRTWRIDAHDRRH